MSFFGDFQFFGYLIIALIPAIILGVLQKPIRYYAFILSLAFIVVIYGEKPIELLYLVIYYLFELGVIRLYLYFRKKYERKSSIYYAFLILSLAPLVCSKVSGLFHMNLLGFLGISYLTFRSIQIIIEAYDGVIKEIDVFEFTCFMLFFPTISSGPIDRSRRFHDDYVKVYEREEYLNLLGDGLQKILLGMCYKFIFGMLLTEAMSALTTYEAWFYSLGYMYAYGFNMFFDFAGYSLMAVGTSYILGIRTPDNFNKPFLSIDIKEFWDRWHISLSHWFRDFIFSRFMMKAIKNKWFKKRLTGAAVGFIVNMFVMGVWHGLTWYYLAYGLYHGILLAVTEIYQKKSKFYKKNKKKKWYLVISWFITFHLVMFGFSIFSGRLFK